MSRNHAVPQSWVVLGTLFFFLGLSRGWAEDPAPAVAPASPALGGGLSASIGTETLGGTTYESFGLLPDISIGSFGVGFDLSFHFQFYKEPGGTFGIYPRAEDFWDSSLSTAQNVDKYLSRIAYVRWGKKGDPLYVQAGLLPSTTFGSGFLVGGYSNGALRPDYKYVGLELDADGSLVGLPVGGFESFVGNISRFDVLGTRVYAKPFGLASEDPIVKNIQFGATFAADTNPYAQALQGVSGSGSVYVVGLDTIVPLVTGDLFSAMATADAAMEGSHAGGAIGVEGKTFTIFSWGLENRFLGDDFLPDYFDQGYEINRISKYQVYSDQTPVSGSIGWQATIGASLLSDQVVLSSTLAGPWTPASDLWAQPSFKAFAQANIKGLPVTLGAFYIKNGLTTPGSLFNPEDAQIGSQIGYTIGAVTLTLVYNLRYLTPGETGTNGNQWVTTSTIQTTVKMF